MKKKCSVESLETWLGALEMATPRRDTETERWKMTNDKDPSIERTKGKFIPGKDSRIWEEPKKERVWHISHTKQKPGRLIAQGLHDNSFNLFLIMGHVEFLTSYYWSAPIISTKFVNDDSYMLLYKLIKKEELKAVDGIVIIQNLKETVYQYIFIFKN